MKVPVTINFDDSQPVIGSVDINIEGIKNLQEYYLSPAFLFNKDTGELKILQYGLVHRSLIPTDEQVRAKEKNVGIK